MGSDPLRVVWTLMATDSMPQATKRIKNQGRELRSLRRSAVCCLSWFVWITAVFLNSGWAQFGFIPFGWSPMALAPVPARVTALAVDPRKDATIYLASPGGGIWRTDDRGQNWRPLSDSFFSVQTCFVTLDPNSPDVLYVGTGDDQSPRPAQGVARSADSGLTWSIATRFTNKPVCTVAVDPANGTRVLASSSEGLFLSTDSAANWRKILPYPATSVAFDGQGNIYVGELGPDDPGSRNNVLVRTSDDGLTWTKFSLPMPSNLMNALTDWVSVLARGNAVYVVISYHTYQSANGMVDFYRSTDAGNTWTVVPRITGSVPPVQIFGDVNAQNLYVAGVDLQASQDQGNTWKTLKSDTGQLHTGALTGGSVLIAGEQGLELVPVSEGAPNGTLGLSMGRFLSVTFDSDGDPWAGGPSGLFDLHKPGLVGVSVGSIGIPATGASKNVFAAGTTAVYHSTDAGVTFTSTEVIPRGEFRAPFPPLLLNPTNPATAFVAGQHLYRTTDSGATWSSIALIDFNTNNVVVALAMPPNGGRVMYAATACLPEVAVSRCSNVSTIWQSTSTGASWTQKSTVLGLVNRLAVDPRQTNTVSAAVGAFPGGPSNSAGYSAGDLLRSTDGGSTWTSIMANLPRVPINAMVIDPTSIPTATPPAGGGLVGTVGPGGTISINFPPPGGFNALLQPAQTMYVGTDAGVYVTFNAGSLWTQINSGLPPAPVTYLSLQQPAGTIEAATFGRGTFQGSVANLSASLVANPLSVNLTVNQGASKRVNLSVANLSSSALKWQLTPIESWISAPTSSGTLQPGGTTTSNFQVSSAGLAIGTYPGRLQISSGSLVQTVLVTLQVTTAPTSMSIVSGNNSSAAPGSTLPPLVVSVTDAAGLPVPGAEISFAVTSGGGILSSRSAISDATGIAKTNLTLPSTPGPVQVVASAGNLSATFTATAVLVSTPSLMANSVVNGVTFNASTPPSPGSIISIFGDNLAASSETAARLPLPTLLQNTRVVLAAPGGDIPLPLFFVSPQQVNALLPYDLNAGTYPLRVESNGVVSNVISIAVAAFSPGIFTMNSNGQGQGIFLKSDGSLVTTSNPAAPGSVVSLFATGLGVVDPPLAAGAPGAASDPLNRTVQTPRVSFDSNPAEVLYSGLAPGFAGLYQVNVRIPAGTAPASNIPVSLSIGGIASNRVAVAVR